jgi:hypothetical protein
LEIDILSRVANLHVNVTDTSFPILPGCSFIHRGEDQDSWSLKDRPLEETHLEEFSTLVSLEDLHKSMRFRKISIHPWRETLYASYHKVHFKGIQGSRRGSRAKTT